MNKNKMNRRVFLDAIIKSGLACAVLPSALTYGRKWHEIAGVIVPDSGVILIKGDSGLDWRWVYRSGCLNGYHKIEDVVRDMNLGTFSLTINFGK